MQVDAAYSKNSLTTNVFYHKMKSRDSFTKELARQKTKIDNSFKATPNQNQNKKPTLESDSSINTISNVENEIPQYVKRNLKYHGQKLEQPSPAVTTGVSHSNGLTLHSAFYSQIKGNNNSHVKFHPLSKEVL